MPYPHSIRLHGPWEYEVLSAAARRPDGSTLAADGLPAPGRMRIPGEWGDSLGKDFRGRVRFRRHFNRPTKLDHHERVWLVCEGVDPCGTVSLNGQPLGDVRGYALPAEFNVTSLLAPRNELRIEVELPQPGITHQSSIRPGREQLPGGIVGDVRLEVRTTHFIERLSLHIKPRPLVAPSSVDDHSMIGATDGRGFIEAVLAGIVRGELAGELLEIVATGPEGELIYAEVPVGQPFELRGPAAGIPDWGSGNAEPGKVQLAEIEVRLIRGGSRLWEAFLHTALPAALRDDLPILEQIDDRRLAECDLAGTPIVQNMPLAWAAELCPGLAHHPSIAAWGATPNELEQLPEEWQNVGCLGHPWVGVAR